MGKPVVEHEQLIHEQSEQGNSCAPDNEFANQVNLIGVKNGETTAAKQTMSTVWQLHNNDGSLNQRFAVIVLGSEDRRADTEKLVSWLGDNFGLH